MAIPAQLRSVDHLLEPKSMGPTDTAYMGAKLAEDPRYGRSCGTSQLAKTLAVYDRSYPGAARAIFVAGSDFEGTSPKLFWPETLVYILPGAGLNQMLTLIVAMKSETPCEPELLLFEGMNDHLYAAGLHEPLRSGEPTPMKIWEAIQTMFAEIEDKSGFPVITGLRKHATCFTVRLRQVKSFCGGKRMADADGGPKS